MPTSYPIITSILRYGVQIRQWAALSHILTSLCEAYVKHVTPGQEYNLYKLSRGPLSDAVY